MLFWFILAFMLHAVWMQVQPLANLWSIQRSRQDQISSLIVTDLMSLFLHELLGSATAWEQVQSGDFWPEVLEEGWISLLYNIIQKNNYFTCIILTCNTMWNKDLSISLTSSLTSVDWWRHVKWSNSSQPHPWDHMSNDNHNVGNTAKQTLGISLSLFAKANPWHRAISAPGSVDWLRLGIWWGCQNKFTGAYRYLGERKKKDFNQPKHIQALFLLILHVYIYVCDIAGSLMK